MTDFFVTFIRKAYGRMIYMDCVKRIWYLSPMRAGKVQASLRICAVSPEPSLLAHTSSESRETFRQKARSLAPLNGWACAVKICHDGMLEDTNSLDGAHMSVPNSLMRQLNLVLDLLKNGKQMKMATSRKKSMLATCNGLFCRGK